MGLVSWTGDQTSTCLPQPPRLTFPSEHPPRSPATKRRTSPIRIAYHSPALLSSEKCKSGGWREEPQGPNIRVGATSSRQGAVAFAEAEAYVTKQGSRNTGNFICVAELRLITSSGVTRRVARDVKRLLARSRALVNRGRRTQ